MNDERVMDLIVDIYNNMNDEDKAGFTLEAAKETVSYTHLRAHET